LFVAYIDFYSGIGRSSGRQLFLFLQLSFAHFLRRRIETFADHAQYLSRLFLTFINPYSVVGSTDWLVRVRLLLKTYGCDNRKTFSTFVNQREGVYVLFIT
jgi:hypothetical protein